MLIKDSITREKFGSVKITSDNNVKILDTMIKQMYNPLALSPSQFYSNWIKGKDSVLEKLSISLLRDYPIELKCGYKTRHFFITSLQGFDVKDYIHDKFNYDINFCKNKLLTYNSKTYIMITGYIMTLTLNKYRIESLYHEHIIFICVKTLFTFFRIYEDDHFLVQTYHAHDLAMKIFNTDISVFDNIAERLGIKSQEQPAKKQEPNPTIEDIMSFITPEDSQTDIKNKIMKWYRCKDRKARQIMAQLGLTNQNYTRKDLRQEY